MNYEYVTRYSNGIDKRDPNKTRRIAAKVLGKPLPPKVVIHHVNGDVGNNDNSNLVICEDQSYHKLLHRRTDALIVCGNANWRRCSHCQEYDDPINLYINEKHNMCFHQECRRLWRKERYRLTCL